MPFSIIRAFGILKKCCAKVNMEYNLEPVIGDAIMRASDKVISGEMK
jgi:fumarate hydratase class II